MLADLTPAERALLMNGVGNHSRRADQSDQDAAAAGQLARRTADWRLQQGRGSLTKLDSFGSLPASFQHRNSRHCPSHLPVLSGEANHKTAAWTQGVPEQKAG